MTHLRALVLLPTRGLAVQVYEIFRELCEGTPLRVGLAAAHDGITFERERSELVRQPRAVASLHAGGGMPRQDSLMLPSFSRMLLRNS